VRKLFLILAGLVVGVGIFATGVICVIYLTSSNTIGAVEIRNNSKVVVGYVELAGSGWSCSLMPEVLPGQSLSGGCLGMPSRMKLPFRLIFYAEGRRYDRPAQVHLLPFGDYNVIVTIDDQMQISVRTIYFMGV
jgi:hypothetical protein